MLIKTPSRNVISMEVGLDRRDFATPVLYMRAKDGIILSGLGEESKNSTRSGTFQEIRIKSLKQDLEKLHRDYEGVADKKRRESNPQEQNNLQLQLDSIAKQIEEIEQQLQ